MTTFEKNGHNNIFQTENGRRRSSAYVFREVISEIAELESHLGRAPSCDEIAEAIGVDTDAYFSLLQEVYLFFNVYDQSLLPEKQILQRHLHAMLGDHVVNITTVAGSIQAKGAEKLERLGNAIERLPEQERLIISLYYFDELTLKEIACVFELNESVCAQLFVQAILRLSSIFKRGAELESTSVEQDLP